MELPENLLQDARNYVDVTWPDVDGDKKLEGILTRGMKYINRVAGSPQDYTVEDKPRELLFDYCRYARDSALDAFEKDYLQELLSLQIDKEVEHAKAQQPDV